MTAAATNSDATATNPNWPVGKTEAKYNEMTAKAERRADSAIFLVFLLIGYHKHLQHMFMHSIAEQMSQASHP